jgi:hypothetical protein
VISKPSPTDIGDPGARFSPHPQVVSQRLGDEIILIHLLTDRIYQLNGTAASIWELMETGLDLAAIKHQLLQEFDAAEAQLNQETARLISMLLAEELVITLNGD